LLAPVLEALGLTPKYTLEGIERSSWGSKGASAGWILDDEGYFDTSFSPDFPRKLGSMVRISG